MNEAYHDSLKKLRDKIDIIDYQIHDLLNQRAQLALQIAKIKIKQDGTDTNFYRPEREAEILRRIKEYNKGPLSATAIAHIFGVIMQECLAIQQANKNHEDTK